MKRNKVCGVVFAITAAMGLGMVAQAKPQDVSPKSANADEKKGGGHGRKTQKIRSGSWVHRERIHSAAPDLRSEFEKRRDRETAIHFERLATIEVIEGLAHSHHKDGLAAQAEGLRRRERERFRLALARLSRAMRQELLARGK